VPLLIVVWIWNWRSAISKFRKAGSSILISGLIPTYSRFRLNAKFFLQLSSLILVIIVLARPQFGSKLEEVKRKGVEIIIALDVSNSMLAEDIQPNRLERAKQSISRLVDELENDRIGLIVFAGDAYTQIPVTTDYISAKMFLSSINPGIVPKQGTAIASAIELGVNSFSPQLDRSKALVIITDGENHEKDPLKSAQIAVDKGVTIHTVGIGSSEGVPIPIEVGGKKEYLKDIDGKTVITKLDDEILKSIALATGGKFVRASNTNLGLSTIFEDIQQMAKQDLEGTLFSEYDEQFQFIAILALLLLVLDLIILERKNRFLSKIKLFEIKM
jgi:Ca-activated chloride channel family protein